MDSPRHGSLGSRRGGDLDAARAAASLAVSRGEGADNLKALQRRGQPPRCRVLGGWSFLHDAVRTTDLSPLSLCQPHHGERHVCLQRVSQEAYPPWRTDGLSVG